jgi:hypothetical protein
VKNGSGAPPGFGRVFARPLIWSGAGLPARSLVHSIRTLRWVATAARCSTIWFHADEAEALRVAAFEQRRKESEIVREAVRRFLGIED